MSKFDFEKSDKNQDEKVAKNPYIFSDSKSCVYSNKSIKMQLNAKLEEL